MILLFLITVSLAAWVSLKQKPVYRTSSTVILGGVTSDILAMKDIEKSKRLDLAYATYIETQREIIKSRRTAYHVIKNLGLGDKEPFNLARDPIRSLLEKLKVDIIKGTEVIRINVEDENPEESSLLSNEFARVYVNSNNASRLQDFADVPSEPVRPNKTLNIMLSVILGIAGSLGIVFFWKSSDIPIKDSEDISALLQLPVLGSVPRIKTSTGNIKTRLGINRIVEKDPLCMASEAYRSIRAKLLLPLNSVGSVAKTIIITSSSPKEGKTISAVNLAIMIARSGESSLLVDLNMKRPRIHAIFNMNNNSGFSNYLSGEADFGSIIKYPGIDNLSIITSGNSFYRPVDSIASKNIKLFLEKVNTGFSKVIFDAPSIVSLADEAVLLNSCDGVAIVVESNKTSVEIVNKLKELLRKKGVNILGVILNNVSF